MHYTDNRSRDQLFKSYGFTRVVRSQSTLQRQLRCQIKKKNLYTLYITNVHLGGNGSVNEPSAFLNDVFTQNVFIVDKLHGQYKLIVIVYFQTGQHGWQP
jgi:hypothetical protein